MREILNTFSLNFKATLKFYFQIFRKTVNDFKE